MTITPTRCHDRDRQNSRRRGAIPRCLNIMRFGYAFMEVGLAIVKRPLLIQDAASLPKEDGLPACVSRNVCHRGKWQDAALLEHEDKDDGDHEDALNRVHDIPIHALWNRRDGYASARVSTRAVGITHGVCRW